MYEYRAQVIRVLDGDSIEVTIDLGFQIYNRHILRLSGVDAPELNARDPAVRMAAQVSKAFLASLISGAVVIIRTRKDSTDKYGRYLADVYREGLHINQEMLLAGHARPYP